MFLNFIDLADSGYNLFLNRLKMYKLRFVNLLLNLFMLFMA